MKRFAFAAVAVSVSVALAGCAGNDYKLYAETQQEIATAKAYADAKRYEALALIAENGDAAAKVAAVMSLNMSGNNNNAEQRVAAPKSTMEQIGDWTAKFLPSAVSFWGIQKNAEVTMHASDNSTSVRMKDYDTMVDLVQGRDDVRVVDPIITDPIIIEDADGNQDVIVPDPVFPIVDRP